MRVNSVGVCGEDALAALPLAISNLTYKEGRLSKEKLKLVRKQQSLILTKIAGCFVLCVWHSGLGQTNMWPYFGSL